MNTNVLEWYKMKIEEISSHKGYIKNTIVYFTDEYSTLEVMGLDWLIDEYSPQHQELLYIEDKIEFTKNGTPLYEIRIFLKQKAV